MAVNDEMPIFVDTNLDTFLALSISSDVTVGDLKRKFEQEHLCCFAKYGEIKVQSLMVKRRSHFYHLPDAMPVKSAFEGFHGTWFLRVSATRFQDMPLHKTCIPSPIQPDIDKSSNSREKQPFISIDRDKNCSVSEIITTEEDRDSSLNISEEQRKYVKIDERKRTPSELVGNTATDNLNHRSLLSGNPLERKEALSMNVSENIVSVTGILSRYFSDFDEVNSCGKDSRHKLEGSHKIGITDYTMRSPEYSVCQNSCKNMMESDTDSVCSSNNIIASDLEQLKAVVIRGKRSSKVREPRKRSKLRASIPFYHKLQVGKKLIQAANNISVSSGKSLPKPMFISRCQNLSAPETSTARRLVFEIDDSND